MSVWVCLQNAIVTAANSHINNYSKNIISPQPLGPLSSVGPWASAPLSPCINAPLAIVYFFSTRGSLTFIKFLCTCMISIFRDVLGWHSQKHQSLDFLHFSPLVSQLYANWNNSVFCCLGIISIIIIPPRGVTVHKIHGSVRYDTVVSRFGMFSIRGRGIAMLELFLF